MKRVHAFAVVLTIAVAVSACGPKKPAAGSPAPDPFPGAGAGSGTSRATTPPPPPKDTVPQPPTIPLDQPVTSGDPLMRAAIEDINRDSPLKPVFFAYDSDALDDTARRTMAGNAEVMKKYSTWIVTIEGHCDERGTAEYNLALGDRRAIAAKNYLMTLGVAAERLKTVSYGNEFPFDPGHAESAWSLNRRAHFMLTAK
jgi:peptidoglycan-associated lipoprotein